MIVGGAISALGFYFLTQQAELLGLICVIAGFVIGFPRSLGLVAGTLFIVTYACIWIAAAYWVSSGQFDEPFDTWFSENSWHIFVWLALLVIQFCVPIVRSQSAWKWLVKDYGQPPENLPREFSLAAIDGFLFVDEEVIDVSAVTSDLALILTREKAGSLFFPWDKVKEVRVRNETPHIADIEVLRRTPVPLRMGIPWAKELAKNVPDSVRVFDA